MCVCLCGSDSECVVVLGAGAETLCDEHVLMSTAVQYPAIPLFLLHTNTQDANFMQAQSSAPCTVCGGSGGTLFGIYMAVIVRRTHGNKVGLGRIYYHTLSEGVLRFGNSHGQVPLMPFKSNTLSIFMHWQLGNRAESREMLLLRGH